MPSNVPVGVIQLGRGKINLGMHCDAPGIMVLASSAPVPTVGEDGEVPTARRASPPKTTAFGPGCDAGRVGAGPSSP